VTLGLLGRNRSVTPLHKVTGDMALKFNGATAADLARWAAALRKVAEEMAAGGRELFEQS
jgi:hypothetical protein